MNRFVACIVTVISGLSLLAMPQSMSAAVEIYSPMKFEEVHGRVLDWLTDRTISDETRNQVNTVWSKSDKAFTADRLLELVVQSFALADPDAMGLLRECNSVPTGFATPKTDVFYQGANSPFYSANLRLFYGRYLVERRLFDEAWDVLKSVDARQVVDPASLFFFQAVAAQGMLELKPALDAIDQLLTNTERVPLRYSSTATLMQADLKGLDEKSLGEVARLMADSERRLELGRAGEKVQGIQERIISNLDEIIKKIEQQQGGGAGGGGQGGNSNDNVSPAEDSSVKGAEAPGETDKKRFENKGTWGNLPEKDLAKAKNDLNKNFPSHYEQAIEKYTKKLAGRAAKKTK